MDNASSTTDFLSIIVRLLGLLVLMVGLYIGIKVIFEAWDLYKHPQNIERFADAIEHGSHLDTMLSQFTSNPNEPKGDSLVQESRHQPAKTEDTLRVSYFIAWIIALFILMIIGSLGFAAIKTGGQLALYDLQVKRFARQLINEARKTNQSD